MAAAEKLLRNVRGMFPNAVMPWKELNGPEVLLRDSEVALTDVLRLGHKLGLGWKVGWLGNVEQPLVPWVLTDTRKIREHGNSVIHQSRPRVNA